MHILGEVVRHGQLLGSLVHLIVAQGDKFANLLVHGAHVTHGLDDIARARLALGTNHGRALRDTAQRLAQVLRTAHERHVELVLVDVVHVVGGAEHFGFVDVVDFNGLQDAGFGNVTDAHLRHDRDGHGFLDALDHGRVAHAGDATGSADVGRDALKRHHRACASVLRDPRLLGGSDVHNHTTLEHLRQILVQFVPVVGHRQPFVENNRLLSILTISHFDFTRTESYNLPKSRFC